MIGLFRKPNEPILKKHPLFPYICRVAFNLHSVINNGLVLGGQNLSRRQTVFFFLVDPRNESHRDPEYIDFFVPRRAQYLLIAWKKHQDAVFWVDIDLAIKEGLTFYQTRWNAIILQGTLPAFCILKVERLKPGEKLYGRQYLSLRPPPKISLEHDHNWTKGMINRALLLNSKLENSFDSLLEKHHVLSFPNQPNPNPIQSVIERGNLWRRKQFLERKNVPFTRDCW